MLLLATVLGLVAPAADAGIERCIAPDGRTYFTDRGCAVAKPFERPKATVRPEVELPPGSLEPAAAAAAPATPAAAAKALPAGVVVETVEPADAIEPADATAAAEAVAGTATPDAVPALAAGDASAPAEPLRKRKSASGHWGLVLLGVAIATIGHFWLMGVAWGAGSRLWSFLIFLFSPLTDLLYFLFNLRNPKAVASFALAAGGIALAASFFVPPTELIDVNESYLTARAQTGVDERDPREHFAVSEKVYMKTVLGWDDWLVGELPYVITWAWYTGDEQVAEFSTEMEFGAAPKVLEGFWPAAELGPGRHHVELYIDDELIDTREFLVQ